MPYQRKAKITVPPRTISDKTIKTDDGDVVRVQRMLPPWKNEAVWVAVGNAGQCYRKADGKRTYIFAGLGLEKFAFDSVDEIEKWMDGLNELRKANP